MWRVYKRCQRLVVRRGRRQGNRNSAKRGLYSPVSFRAAPEDTNASFVASWRPIYQNRFGVRVIGSPFKTLTAAKQACEVILGHLVSDTG
jgi:hypothetical protein